MSLRLLYERFLRLETENTFINQPVRLLRIYSEHCIALATLSYYAKTIQKPSVKRRKNPIKYTISVVCNVSSVKTTRLPYYRQSRAFP